MSNPTEQLPTRADVQACDTWDLATLFVTDAAWETTFAEWETMIPEYANHRGKLGESVATQRI